MIKKTPMIENDKNLKESAPCQSTKLLWLNSRWQHVGIAIRFLQVSFISNFLLGSFRDRDRMSAEFNATIKMRTLVRVQVDLWKRLWGSFSWFPGLLRGQTRGSDVCLDSSWPQFDYPPPLYYNCIKVFTLVLTSLQEVVLQHLIAT